jgi:predicted ATPase
MNCTLFMDELAADILAGMRVKNFKALRNVDLKFSKINLLIGKNSTGKSSVFQLLAMLKQSFMKSTVAYSNDLVNLGSFNSIVHKGDPSNSIEISLLVNLKSSSAREAIEKKMNMSLSQITYSLKIRRGNIVKQSIKAGENIIAKAFLSKKRKWENKSDIISDLRGGMHLFLDFQSKEFQRELGKIRSCISLVLNHFFPLFLDRGITQREFSLGPYEPREIYQRGKCGLNVANFLMYTIGKSEFEEIKREINYWSQKLFSSNVEPSPSGSYVSVNYKDEILEKFTNLMDSGYGMNQMLPVIIQCVLAPEGSLIAVEEPEIHLHPNLQAAIMDFFIEMAKRDLQVLITTHSEHMLMRLQRRIAEQKLSPGDVAIYFFDIEQNASKATNIDIDVFGRIEGTFPGFFERDFEEFGSIIKAFSRRKKN